RAAFNLPLRAAGLALIWCVCSAIAMYCGLLLMQLLLAGERTATTVGGLFMVPLAMLGGCFFPMESMPFGLAAFAEHTPNGWMLVHLRNILTGPVARTELAVNFGILLAVSALLFLLVRWRMERRFVA